MATWPTTEAHIRANIHPNYRSIWLGHIRQVRAMMRAGRYALDGQRIIKDAQRELLSARQALREAA